MFVPSISDTTSNSTHSTWAKEEGNQIQFLMALMTYLN